MSVEKNVPEIRFKGFSDAWIKEKISNIAPLQRGFDLPKSEMKIGQYPVVMSNGVNGFHNISKSRAPGVITGRSGTIGNIHYVDVDYWPHNTALWVTNFHGNDPRFVYYLYVKLDLKRFGTGSGVPTLNRNDVHDQLMALPEESNEQNQIGSYFKKLDSLINQHQKKHDKLSKLKKSMLEKMFPKQGETTPEIRFKGFSGEWEEAPLKKVASDITDGNWIESEHIFDSGEYRIIQTGNIGVGQYLDRPKHAKYFHQFNFDAVRGNEIFPGDILISRLADPAGRAVILPNTGYRMVTAVDVAIVRPEPCFDSYFLMTLLNKDEALKAVSEWVSGTSHKRISHANLVKVKTVVPCVEEQTAIGNYFQKLDTLINQHQQQITKLKNIKQACLSKMFV